MSEETNNYKTLEHFNDFKNDLAQAAVNTKQSKLKELIVDFTGNELGLQEEVTVENVINVLAAQFPEILLVVAEENFFRGYEQALEDIELHTKNIERLQTENSEA